MTESLTISKTSGPGASRLRALVFFVPLALAVLLSACRPSPANEGLEGVYLTNEGYAACQDEDRFHELMEHVASGESDEYRSLLEDASTGCILLEQDVEVEVVTWNVTFAEIRPLEASSSVWTVAEAVRPAEDAEAPPSDDP